MTDSALPPANFPCPPRRRCSRPVVADRSSAGCSGSIRTARPRPGNPGGPANEGSSKCCATASSQRIRARPARAIRLGRCNTVSGISFFLGGGLFTLGAVLSQLDAATPSTINWTFLVGGFFFSTGAYAALVQEINSPRGIDEDGALTENRWRWWAYEPTRPGWMAAFVLFCGTLAFAISLVDVFIERLETQQIDRLVWAPEMVGCVLFLVSGHIGIIEVCHGRFRLLPRDLGWWIVTVNQVGSWLFFLSGLAAFVRPATGEVINVAVINWGTALGAACFSVAGLAQLFERPDSAPAPDHRAGRRQRPAAGRD